MKILIIGSGGREHALAWKIAQSKLVDKIFCAPGNGGISDLAECPDIKAEDVSGLRDFALREKIDLTVVGPEIPLSLGIVDEFVKYKLNIFGPNKQCARLEASKIFAKELMAKYHVPTADFKIFDNPLEAKKYIKNKGAPCVVKADGLAAGKGVVVAKTLEEAENAIDQMLVNKAFGEAGKRVIIEECLEGQEASILVLTDSKTVVPLASSQDHKRLFDNDFGPNTGGMGAYSPAPVVTKVLFNEIMETVVNRILAGLAKEGLIYKGVLYAGIMITKQGPKVLEFNVRFGDPETQVILPRIQSDLAEVMFAAAQGSLGTAVKSGNLNWDNRACVSVVCASKGYPGECELGKEIFGLDEMAKMKDVVAFHAGTKKFTVHGSQLTDNFKYLTNGGRVLNVTGLGSTIKEAIDTTYKAVEKIHFEGMQYRGDIGRRALEG